MGKFDDYINVTAPLHSATTKGKLGNANEIFTENDEDNVQNVINKTNEHIKKLDNRSSQMEESIKDISVTGGASTANAVSYNNSTSKLEAITAQGAIDELASKKANSADVTSLMQTEQTRVNTELAKKFNSENITLELGDSEELVMSQKTVSTKLNELSSIFSNEVGRIQQNIHGLDKTISISEFKIGWNEISSFAAIANVTYNIIISLDVVISSGVYVRIKENEAVKQTLEIKSIKNISFVCDKPSNISIEYNKYAIDLSNNSMHISITCNATIPAMSQFNDIEGKIENLNNTTNDKIGGKYIRTSIEPKLVNKFISLDGNVYDSAGYFISNPITLYKGEKIEAHINIIDDNVVGVISKRIAEDRYEVLSIGHIAQEVYTFMATEDCEVALCYKTISLITIDRIGSINRKINDLGKKAHHILHVGKDEKYKTINSACSDAINGDVIIVHEGTYNESVNISACDTTEDHKTVQNLSHFKDIAIIGVDKEKCILQNDLGLYASPPLWMTNGLLKNMTIKSLHTNNSRNNISYAIHIDGAIYSNGCKTPLTVDNCTVYSENSNSLGCGIDDVDIIVTNSEIQSTSLGTYPMAVHNSSHCRANGSKVKLKNNIFKGSYKTCLWFNKISSTSEEDKFEVLAIGNILHSNYEYKASDLTQNDNIANMSELNAFNRGSLILGE